MYLAMLCVLMQMFCVPPRNFAFAFINTNVFLRGNAKVLQANAKFLGGNASILQENAKAMNYFLSHLIFSLPPPRPIRASVHYLQNNVPRPGKSIIDFMLTRPDLMFPHQYMPSLVALIVKIQLLIGSLYLCNGSV